MNASLEFKSGLLRFGITGEGVVLDPVTGQISIATETLASGLTLTVTAGSEGAASASRFRLTLAAVEILPTLIAPPALVGEPKVGVPLSVDPGLWAGVPAPSLAFQWLLDGVEIPGAVEAAYVPRVADDRGALACRVSAVNPAGGAEASTPALAVSQIAPVALGGLPDLELGAGDPPATVAAGPAFAGAGLTFAVSGAGATINSATGLVTIATDARLQSERITVTARNSGGAATSGFLVSVRATPPVLAAGPFLSGSGRIGEPVTVDPGTWSGIPAPALALQWLCDGTEIAGATGEIYVPGDAEDARALSCRVTASNPAGAVVAETASIAVTRTPPVTVAALADVTAGLGTEPMTVEAGVAFAGEGLVFAVTGAGATIDAATGRITIPADTIRDHETVTVTASNSGGVAASGFLVTVQAIPPALVAGPVLSAGGRVGQPVSVDPGTWSGLPAPVLALQWLRDGGEIAGATGASYTPVAADDRTALSCRVTASNPAGAVVAETASIAVTRTPPVTVATLADIGAEVGAEPLTVEAGVAFAGEGLVFAVTGAGATIDAATGRITIPADTIRDHETVTVTASNSGGVAASGFLVTVRAIPPALVAGPVLSAGGRVGQPVSVDPGTWSGLPAPVLALQWLRDGGEIAGATGASYTPVAADDRTALSCRVTASNPAGAVVAETASIAVTRTPPVTVATLADIGAEVGAEPLTVEAGVAFAGEGLAFAVTGAGATIDAATGRVTLPADTARDHETVTVTATNSGGTASAVFRVTLVEPAPLVIPPLLLVVPVLAGTAKIGQAVTVETGTWGGTPAPSLACQWLRNGVEIAGATGTTYTPVAADDRTALSCRVAAANAGGSAVALTAALAVTYMAPVARGQILEEIFDQGSGVQTVPAGLDFEGENLSFTVAGGGATIDPATGVVSIPTAAALSATVIVTAMNSGGTATSAFPVTVETAEEEAEIPFALAAGHITILRSVWRPAAQEILVHPDRALSRSRRRDRGRHRVDHGQGSGRRQPVRGGEPHRCHRQPPAPHARSGQERARRQAADRLQRLAP